MRSAPGTARGPGRPPRWALAVLLVAAAAAASAPLLDDRLSVVRADGPPLAGPGPTRWLGTDENGRSVLALALAGARTSLVVAGTATLAAMAVACAVGVLVAVTDGTPARLLAAAGEQVTQCFLALPPVPVALAVSAGAGAGTSTVICAIAVTSWAAPARIVRATVLAEAARPHLDRSRALGADRRHQVREHVLPAAAPVLAATAVLTFANAVLTESGMSFLGLGDARGVSWGAMLRDAASSGAFTAGAWAYVLTPGVCITLVVSALGACARHLDRDLDLDLDG